MTFIEITDRSGESVYVNPTCIASIAPFKLYNDENSYWSVELSSGKQLTLTDHEYMRLRTVADIDVR